MDVLFEKFCPSRRKAGVKNLYVFLPLRVNVTERAI
jgi:hypothetical protein